MIFPVDFRQKVALPPGVNGKGSPYQISAEDLMRDFEFAALDIDPTQTGAITLQISVADGKRKISIVTNPPSSGTQVLGSIDGVIQWIETEGCD